MLRPRNRLVRYCAACSSAIPIHEEECPHCSRVISLTLGPGERETEQILSGRVLHNGGWVTPAEKIEAERELAKQLAAGLVEHNGQWIRIEEKARTLQEQARDPAEKIVDFPRVQPETVLPPRERPVNLAVRRARRQRRVVVIALSLCSFLTMAFALIGILVSMH